MDLKLKNKNKDLVDKAKEISTNILAPNADKYDSYAEFRSINFDKLFIFK